MPAAAAAATTVTNGTGCGGGDKSAPRPTFERIGKGNRREDRKERQGKARKRKNVIKFD